MQTEIIKVTTWCDHYPIEYSFIEDLADRGLIKFTVIEGQNYIHHDQLTELEQFTRWHNDMDINLEGIETISHLLNKIRSMQEEVALLKTRLLLYE